ncbi:MAG: hypothetical protein Q9183_002976 [Haloplaca sp. 2 TL-2023]
MPICWSEAGKHALSEDLLKEPEEKDGIALILPPAIERIENKAFDPKSGTNRVNGLLPAQRRKLRADWALVSGLLPETSFEKYCYNWLIVNTRSFYFEMPNVKKHPPRADRMVMCPLVDLFNHNDTGCHVKFEASGYTVISDKDYGMYSWVHIRLFANLCPSEAGDEVFVSYGRHSNDFLLVECESTCNCESRPMAKVERKDGFVLEKNQWDSTSVDTFVMDACAGTPVEKQLQVAGYLGTSDYTLSQDGICYRTEVAIRAQTLARADWERFIEGIDVERLEDDDFNALIQSYLLMPFRLKAQNAIRMLRNPGKVPPGARRSLIMRWKQILRFLQVLL